MLCFCNDYLTDKQLIMQQIWKSINRLRISQEEFFFPGFYIILYRTCQGFVALAGLNKQSENITLGSGKIVTFHYFLHLIDKIINWLIGKIINRLIINENSHYSCSPNPIIKQNEIELIN